jgi:hypothetical protein
MMNKSSLISRASPLGRRVMICKAESFDAPTTSTDAPTSSMKVPEWIPEQVAPVIEFLNSSTFKVSDIAIPAQIKTYIDNKYVVESTGFKPMAETINGRLAMVGFLTAAIFELGGSGSALRQLSSGSSPFVLATMALFIAASVIPVVKGTEGGYLDSLKDTYGLPEGVFTEPMERIHGRLAMMGFLGLVIVELVIGGAVL